MWPASADRDDDGVLDIAGVSAARAARTRFGTPLLRARRGRGARARAPHARAPSDARPQPHGARRASTTPARRSCRTEVVRWVIDEGLAVDVCTGGELAVALAAGADPARLGFHGNNKSRRRDSSAPSQVGIGSIVDRQLRSSSSASPRSSARDRRRRSACSCASTAACTPRPTTSSRPPTRTRSSASRSTDAAAVVARIRETAGAATSSGCTATSARRSSAPPASGSPRRALLELHAALLDGGDIPVLNLGGGFGIAYTSRRRPDADRGARGRDRRRPSRASARRAASRCPNLAFEPGRAIVGTGRRHALRGRHHQGRRGRRPARSACTSASTAA